MVEIKTYQLTLTMGQLELIKVAVRDAVIKVEFVSARRNYLEIIDTVIAAMEYQDAHGRPPSTYKFAVGRAGRSDLVETRLMPDITVLLDGELRDVMREATMKGDLDLCDLATQEIERRKKVSK